jgi:RNA polymerase sigma-70 factor (ECF subfamily)
MQTRDDSTPQYEDWSAVMEALLQGTPEAPRAFAKLNRLISDILASVRAFDHREEWEDLGQVVLEKLVKSCSRGQLREPKAFVAYVVMITRHEFYDFLRARRGTEVVEFPPVEVEPQEVRDTVTTVAVRTALQRLPEKQRLAVHAVYVEDRTYEEAAAATTIPLGSLKRYLKEGLEELRQHFSEDG